jgi:hypothetical protein
MTRDIYDILADSSAKFEQAKAAIKGYRDVREELRAILPGLNEMPAVWFGVLDRKFKRLLEEENNN